LSCLVYSWFRDVVVLSLFVSCVLLSSSFVVWFACVFIHSRVSGIISIGEDKLSSSRKVFVKIQVNELEYRKIMVNECGIEIH